MKTVTKNITGVVAEYQGKYWGTLYKDGYGETYGYVTIDRAKIADPAYCKSPTDMTWNPNNSRFGNSDYDSLLLASLKKITVTTTFWVED